MSQEVRIGWITDGRPVNGALPADGRTVEILTIARSPVDGGAPDVAGLADRVRSGNFQLLWIHVEVEALLTVTRAVSTLGLPILVSSPGCGTRTDLASFIGLLRFEHVAVAIADEFAASPGLFVARNAVERTGGVPSAVELKVVVPLMLHMAADSRSERERLLGYVSDCMVLLRSFGFRWTASRLRLEMSKCYWARFALELDLEGGGTGTLVVQGNDGQHSTTLNATFPTSQMDFRRAAGEEVVSLRQGNRSANRTFPFGNWRDHTTTWMLSWADINRQFDDTFLDRVEVFEEALDRVDEYLHGHLLELQRVSFEEVKSDLDSAGSPFLKYDLRHGGARPSFIATTEETAALLKPVEGPPLRLLLVRPPFLGEPPAQHIVPPLGMAQVAASATLIGTQVQLVDLAPLCPAEGNRPPRIDVDALVRVLFDKTEGRTFDLAGFSLTDPAAWWCVEALAKAIRGKLAPRIVVGGEFMSQISDEQTAASGAIDFAVRSEGELAILHLLRSVREDVDMDRVPGLWRAGHDRTQPCLTDFALNPTPIFDGLDLSLYNSGKPAVKTPFLLYQFVGGCPFRCAFCSTRNGHKPRVRPVDKVVSDLRTLRDKYDVHNFMFMNNLVNYTPKYLDDFLDAMEDADLKIRWCDCARPGHLSRRQIERLVGIGCAALVWGIETGSQRLADRHQKDMNLVEVEEVLKTCHEFGIVNYGNFIVGLPHETQEDFDETRRFMKRIAGFTDYTELMTYVFMHDSAHFLDPRKFGLLRKGNIFDEVGGQTWPEQVITRDRRLEILRGDFWVWEQARGRAARGR